MQRNIDLKKRWRGAPTWVWLLGAAAVVALAVFVVLDENAGNEARKDREMQALVNSLETREVVYEVEGDGAYSDVTAQTPTGVVQSTVELPMQTASGGRVTERFQAGESVRLSAQSRDGRTITCRITIDGRVVSENTSTGEFAIASCEGAA